jgi:NAD(P)-dependent dehydrogenase (short-subunit alcohol dehydrogenase family)
MTSLNITDADIPSLEGKVAMVTGKQMPQCILPILADTSAERTGGASGIGLAAVKILTSKGSKTFILDLAPPEDIVPAGATFIRCDTTSWTDLKRAYAQAGNVDIAIANAGVSEEQNYLEDQFDSDGELVQPRYDKIIDVNLRGVLDFVKLALSNMRRHGGGGSIVITSSATAYAPEQSLPVYSAVKHAVRHWDWSP